MSNIGDGTLHRALLDLIDKTIPHSDGVYDLTSYQEWFPVFSALEWEGQFVYDGDDIFLSV